MSSQQKHQKAHPAECQAAAWATNKRPTHPNFLKSYCDSQYDKNIVFYTGHGWNQTNINGANHYHIYSSTSGSWSDGIQDSSIHSRTTSGKHNFVFIWACFQGNEVGYDHVSGGVGMPHAWTQRTNLNTNGYSNNDGTAYCWIGFKDTSPPLHDDAGPYGYEYGNFVKYFYYFLTYHGNTVHQALDNAADWVYRQNFAACPLYTVFTWVDPTHGNMTGYMKVYGNSWKTLP